MGLDIDTLYGQLLRRMPITEDPHAHFAVVVPSSALSAAIRVPTTVRFALRIVVYSVDDDDQVSLVDA